MSKESKAAASGAEEIRPAAPLEPAADGTKTVEEWATIKGFADITEPHPHYAQRGWVQKVVDVGAGNRALFAFARAYHQWAIGKRLTEQQFESAMRQVQERKFGEHPEPR